MSAVLLDDRGKVQSDSDLVFFNHPHQDGVTLSGHSIIAELGQIPASAHTVAVVASETPAATFTPGTTPSVTIGAEVQRTFVSIPLRDGETVVTLVELYPARHRLEGPRRRPDYPNGLASLATNLGRGLRPLP